MKRTNTVIVGAGQSGLAVSHELDQLGVDHVILERGQVGNSWRQERWDSLRLLSPNWMNGLPGNPYSGDDHDGFMPVPELVARMEQCAVRNNAPVLTETGVLSVDPVSGGYRVQTDQGAIDCENVVMANGACAKPKIPAFSTNLPSHIQQITPLEYKRPSDLSEGNVLVVGASASGLQLAQEIQVSGRQVTLAVGNHLRMPRHYRDLDILMWMDIIGATTIPYTDVDDIERSRRVPSLPLVAGQTLDLNSLQNLGVEITGRLVEVQDGTAWFSGSLANHCAAADLKMNRLLASIDDWIETSGLNELVAPGERYTPTGYSSDPRLKANLASESFGSVIWATGYKPDFSWLKLSVFDRKGRLEHQGGVVSEGLYVMGLPYLRQRKSTFIDGASDDARALADHLFNRLGRRLAA